MASASPPSPCGPGKEHSHPEGDVSALPGWGGPRGHLISLFPALSFTGHRRFVPTSRAGSDTTTPAPSQGWSRGAPDRLAHAPRAGRAPACSGAKGRAEDPGAPSPGWERGKLRRTRSCLPARPTRRLPESAAKLASRDPA